MFGQEACHTFMLFFGNGVKKIKDDKLKDRSQQLEMLVDAAETLIPTKF